MYDLPFTPQLTSIFKKSQELNELLERNRVDIDVFFHSFINDLSLSCSTLLEKFSSEEALRLASLQVIEKKKPQKITSRKYSTNLNKLIEECEIIQRDIFGLDYIGPESILL